MPSQDSKTYAARYRAIRQLPSGSWQARWYDSKRVRHSRTFATERKAKDFLDTVSADRQRGTYLNPRDGRRSLGELADRWIASKTLRPKTEAAYRTIIEHRIKPKFGSIALVDIDALDIQTWAKELHDSGLSAGTVRNTIRVLRQVLDAAVKNRYLIANPARSIAGTDLPSYKPARRTPLTADQVKRLVSAFETDYPAFALLVRFAVDTGMRAGEVNALRWDAVDLPERKVYVRQSVSRVGATNHLNLPKNGEQRVVDIGASLARELRDYADGLPVHPRFVLGAYVWPSASAADEPMAWSRDFYLPLWKATVACAELPADLRFHDLRHTCASLLIAANVPVKVIQERLGHSSYKITMDTYGHLYPKAADVATSVMDQLFGG
jgi:integrase